MLLSSSTQRIDCLFSPFYLLIALEKRTFSTRILRDAPCTLFVISSWTVSIEYPFTKLYNIHGITRQKKEDLQEQRSIKKIVRSKCYTAKQKSLVQNYSIISFSRFHLFYANQHVPSISLSGSRAKVSWLNPLVSKSSNCSSVLRKRCSEYQKTY